MYGKILIHCKLIVCTGMHIGDSSAFSAIGAVDSTVVRDPLTGLPIVPGSSLKGKLRTLLAKYAEVELLLKIGEYKKGTDPETDEAIAKNGAINAFLRQGLDERPTYDDTIARLKSAVS